MKTRLSIRRDRIFMAFLAAALLGAVALFGQITWLLWQESVSAEEARVAAIARDLGERAENMIVDARVLLETFNNSDSPRCGATHIDAMQAAAISRPHIRAIGFWRATDRICGVGFVQGAALKPPRADRIYDSGVIAWWPGEDTRIGGLPLFLMRYGDHDVAIDTRMLLPDEIEDDRLAGLWVEGLPMASTDDFSALPALTSLPEGLTLDNANDRVLSRFSLGTVFPIDIIAIETLDRFWARYLPLLSAAVFLGLLLAAAWIYLVMRYSRHRMSLATDLRNALNSGHIVPHYQPIVELGSGRCIGAEALARWIRPDGERIGPDVFIPLAEQHNMVPDITVAILDATLRDLGDVLKQQPLLRININLAPEDLTDVVFQQRLRAQLANAAVPSQCIKLEITERAMVNTDQSRRQIQELRSRGHEIAIDDFGTGYSSLAYLESFELDTLKIDKSFVDAIGTEAVTQNVVGHVIDMAKTLKLNTVAEGIETAEQALWLKAHGVAYGQGFFYGKPLPAQAFRDLIETELDRRQANKPT